MQVSNIIKILRYHFQLELSRMFHVKDFTCIGFYNCEFASKLKKVALNGKESFLQFFLMGTVVSLMVSSWLVSCFNMIT